MGVQLEEIKKVCKAIGGIQRISITAMDNLNLAGGSVSVIDPAKLYAVAFRNQSAGLNDKHKDTRHGGYIDQSLSFFVPGKRLDAEHIRSQLLNKRIAVSFNDENGTGGMLMDAKMKCDYFIGKQKSQGQGYNFNFTTQSLLKSLDYSGVGISLPDAGDPGYGDPGGSGTSSCCITINPVQLSYVPTASGNTQNLSKLVKDINGIPWLIDKDGLGMKLGSSNYPEYYEKFTSISGTKRVPVTVCTLPTIDVDEKLIVIFNQTQLNYSGATATDMRMYGIDQATNELMFYRNLKAHEIIKLYVIKL